MLFVNVKRKPTISMRLRDAFEVIRLHTVTIESEELMNICLSNYEKVLPSTNNNRKAFCSGECYSVLRLVLGLVI